MTADLLTRAIKKASQSICKYKISAMGFDKKGRLIGTSFNRPRFSRHGGSIHAEMELMAQYGINLKTIIICRTNLSGELLEIDACETCQKKANELGIKIKTIK
jgi:hypothetical protein